jgi:hypothetical protein
MTTRDRIQKAVEALMVEISAAIDDTDVTENARHDLMRLYVGIDHKFQAFNLPDGPDLSTGCGPTQTDIAGEVVHVPAPF